MPAAAVVLASTGLGQAKVGAAATGGGVGVGVAVGDVGVPELLQAIPMPKISIATTARVILKSRLGAELKVTFTTVKDSILSHRAGEAKAALRCARSRIRQDSIGAALALDMLQSQLVSESPIPIADLRPAIGWITVPMNDDVRDADLAQAGEARRVGKGCQFPG